ncbi:MAG TPA: dTMP kinase [Methylocystis sp.]|nr:dTMP kinase [Methylocystis sp.]
MTGAASTFKGRLITFEGGEGAGKSTQLKRLAERLRQAGVDVVETREPGGTPLAEKLREMLLSGRIAPLGAFAEAVVFAAARIDHVDSRVAPALDRGAFVLCDRFIDSTRAYQGALGGVEPGRIALLEKIALGDLRPDLTIILDLPAEEGLARAARRRAHGAAADRFEREELSRHEELRDAFLEIAAAEPDRCCVLDTTRPVEEASLAIWRLVEARFLGKAA